MMKIFIHFFISLIVQVPKQALSITDLFFVMLAVYLLSELAFVHQLLL